MNAFGIAALTGLLGFVAIHAHADDVAAPDKGKTTLPTKKDKQHAVEEATRAGSPSAGAALGERGPPKPEKSWNEMTPAEQEAARKRWLLNSGDFGPRRGTPRPPPTTDKGQPAIDGTRAPSGQQENKPAK